MSPFSAHLVRQRRWYRLENTNNYYYVPTFYIADEKVHEGGIYPNEVEAIFKRLWYKSNKKFLLSFPRVSTLLSVVEVKR